MIDSRRKPPLLNAAEALVGKLVRNGLGNRTALLFGDTQISYQALDGMISRAAGALRDLGVEIEDRVALLLPDCPYAVAAFLGAIKLGGVAVPLGPLYTPDDYLYMLEDSRAKVLVVDETLAGKVVNARSECRYLKSVVVVHSHGARGGKELSSGQGDVSGGEVSIDQGSPGVGEFPVDPGVPDEGRLPPGTDAWFEELCAVCVPEEEPAPTVEGDSAYWNYTSGTSGPPKGVVKSQYALVHKADYAWGDYVPGPGDVVYSLAKLSADYGIHNLVSALSAGIALVLDPERPTAKRVVEVIQRYRPTVFLGVPRILARILDLPGVSRDAFSCVKLCKVGAEPLPPDVYTRFRERFGVEPLEVMGTSETGGELIKSRPGRSRPGALGEANEGRILKLVDEKLQEVGPGVVGRLMVKDPAMATGYWNRLKETRAVFLGEWVLTPDLFVKDEDGFFWFKGRVDDVIDVGGWKVIPNEVEEVLKTHRAVADCGVVGAPDKDGLSVPVALVVLKEGVSPSESLASELREFVKKRLAPYNQPRQVRFVESLPRSALGKLERYKLRNL